MNKSELLEIIANGENSGVEFKDVRVSAEGLAKEIVALANFRGGRILLGVDDQGRIAGIASRPDLEEWVMNVCRDRVRPAIIPYYEEIEVQPDQCVAVLTVDAGPFKPYRTMQRGREIVFIRVGSTSREASVDEIARMVQAAGALHFELSPVPGSGFEHLSQARLRDYFMRAIRLDWGSMAREKQQRELVKAGFLTRHADRVAATMAGLLLFGQDGSEVKRFVPQSGITAVRLAGAELDAPIRATRDLRGPLPGLFDSGGRLVEAGLVDLADAFVRQYTDVEEHFEGGRRVNRWTYPLEIVREIVVNAVVHRDYTIAGTDITLFITDDRLEVRSPGRLPNTVTIAGIEAGVNRYARNQTLVNVMRDYQYIEYMGRGIAHKVIPGMLAHNGTRPILREYDEMFSVTLLAG